MSYKVLKPIPNGDGTYHQTGDIVNAAGWRNLRQLVNGRYLVEVSSSAEPSADAPVEQPKPSRKRKSAADSES